MKAILFGLVFCVAQAGAAEKGFTPLFNGKNLEGWQGMGGPTTNWAVKDGVLSCTGKKGSQWIATKEEYADFDLRLEFKIPKNGNSGVFIRAPKDGAPWVAGMEIQVLDDFGDKWKNLKPTQFTGSIYAVQPPSKRATKKAGQWQTMRIRCEGAKCDVWINGEHVVKSNLAELAKTNNQPGLKRKTGFIGLQNHSSPVHYRNLRVKTLK
jgi:hypothetical protein